MPFIWNNTWSKWWPVPYIPHTSSNWNSRVPSLAFSLISKDDSTFKIKIQWQQVYVVDVYAVGFRLGMICNMMTILQTSCCLFSLATLHFRTITMPVVPCKLFAFFFTRETHLSRMRKNPSNLQLKYSHTFSTRRWWFPVINTFDLFCFISTTQVLQISKIMMI